MKSALICMSVLLANGGLSNRICANLLAALATFHLATSAFRACMKGCLFIAAAYRLEMAIMVRLGRVPTCIRWAPEFAH